MRVSSSYVTSGGSALSSRVVSPPTANHLLAALPAEDLERLMSQMKPVPLHLGSMAYRAHQPVEWVHFPTQGVVSLVVSSQSGMDVEVNLIGREGMVGISSVLNGSPNEYATVQVQGEGYRIPAGALREEFNRGGALHDLMLRYLRVLLGQTSQIALCNRLHPVEERLSRWLLMVGDRIGTDSFDLTQELIAQMLGVHRPGVTVAAGTLREAGLINYTRGRIQILDRPGLQDSACECYRVFQGDADAATNNS